MSWLWILVVAFMTNYGVSEVCNGRINFYDTVINYSTVRIKRMEISINSHGDRQNGSCELTATQQKQICDGFNQWNSSWPAELAFTCDVQGYGLQVSQSPKTLNECSGQIIYGLQIQNCTVGWEDIFHMATFADPRLISLKDIPYIKHTYETRATSNRFPFIRATIIDISSTSNYRITSYKLLHPKDILKEPYRSCVSCGMKTYEKAPAYLDSFPRETFPNVSGLNIVDTNMSTITDFRSFGELRQLLVINGGLTKIPLWTIAQTRKRVDFSQWERAVFKGLFQRLDKLWFLYRPDSPMAYEDSPIRNMAFRHLREEYLTLELDLSVNSIQHIDHIEGMERLEGITLQYNDLHGSRISNLTLARNIIVLNLSFNPLVHIPDNLFNDSKNLGALYLRNCQLNSLQSVVNQDLKALQLLDVAENNLEEIPMKLYFLPNLILLTVENNKIAYLTFPQDSFRSQLYFIDLGINHLKTFPGQLLTSSFPKLMDLALRGNELTTESMVLMVQQESSQIRSGERGVIELMFNCIEYIPLAGQREVETLDRVLDSFTLYLHHNPLHCGCEEMIAWLQSRGVRNTFAIKCTKGTLWFSDSVLETLLLLFPMKRCDKYIREPYPYRCSADIYKERVVKVATSTMFGLLVLVALIVLVKRQSFYLQQWLFILTGLRLCRRQKQGDLSLYDVFVCYCSDDYHWVFQTLLPGLEEACDPPYSLCVHDRDFVVGKDIADNVMDAMEASRVVILVLSPSSAQSEWCGFEINAAIEERILGQKQLPIIPVIHDHVNLQAFTRKQRRVLKKIPFLLSDDVKIITKLKFVLGEPLPIPEDGLAQLGETGSIQDMEEDTV